MINVSHVSEPFPWCNLKVTRSMMTKFWTMKTFWNVVIFFFSFEKYIWHNFCTQKEKKKRYPTIYFHTCTHIPNVELTVSYLPYSTWQSWVWCGNSCLMGTCPFLRSSHSHGQLLRLQVEWHHHMAHHYQTPSLVKSREKWHFYLMWHAIKAPLFEHSVLHYTFRSNSFREVYFTSSGEAILCFTPLPSTLCLLLIYGSVLLLPCTPIQH